MSFTKPYALVEVPKPPPVTLLLSYIVGAWDPAPGLNACSLNDFLSNLPVSEPILYLGEALAVIGSLTEI